MKSIPSPFMGNDEKFMDELGILCEKFGYKQIFIAYSKEELEVYESTWNAHSNTISEGLKDYLKDNVDFMEDQLEKYGQ